MRIQDEASPAAILVGCAELILEQRAADRTEVEIVKSRIREHVATHERECDCGLTVWLCAAGTMKNLTLAILDARQRLRDKQCRN